MTQIILDSIDMKDTHIFYNHYHLKFNLEISINELENITTHHKFNV